MKKFVCIILLFAALLTCVSCSKEPQFTDEPFVVIAPQKDYAIAGSVTSMAEQSTYIVVGTYTALDSKWNMMRNPDDPTKEASEDYSEGHLYKFSVEEVLKGSLSESEILVNHEYSETFTFTESNQKVENGVITQEATWSVDHKVNIISDLYIAPEIGSSYILFLDKDMYYYGSCEPFMIKLNGDTAELCSNIFVDEEASADNSSNLISTAYNVDGREIIVYSSLIIAHDFVGGASADSIMDEIHASVLLNPDDVIY